MKLLSLFGVSFMEFALWDIGSPNFHWFQLITSMFIHGGIFHIFGNMLALLSLGPIVEERMTTKRFLFYYLFCGVIGGLLQSTLTVGPAVGASGAIWGIVMMFVLISPNMKLSLFLLPIGIKAKYLIGVLFLIELVSAFNGSSDNIGHFAHIGGGLTGASLFLYERYISRNVNF